MTLIFDPSMVWTDAYQRNNKANGQKNLRCFPGCCEAVGHQRGFCGQCECAGTLRCADLFDGSRPPSCC